MSADMAPGRHSGHNVHMAAADPSPPRIAPSPSAEEAAAIAAALGRFMRATAPPHSAAGEDPDPWQRAAILEGVSREPRADVPDPWINT